MIDQEKLSVQQRLSVESYLNETFCEEILVRVPKSIACGIRQATSLDDDGGIEFFFHLLLASSEFPSFLARINEDFRRGHEGLAGAFIGAQRRYMGGS